MGHLATARRGCSSAPTCRTGTGPSCRERCRARCSWTATTVGGRGDVGARGRSQGRPITPLADLRPVLLALPRLQGRLRPPLVRPGARGLPHLVRDVATGPGPCPGPQRNERACAVLVPRRAAVPARRRGGAWVQTAVASSCGTPAARVAGGGGARPGQTARSACTVVLSGRLAVSLGADSAHASRWRANCEEDRRRRPGIDGCHGDAQG